MAVKFYSDVTKKYYDDQAAAEKAEQDIIKARDDKLARRKESAKKVEDCRKAYIDARKAYYEELTKFCKEFGAYHATVSKEEADSLIDSIWNDFLW